MEKTQYFKPHTSLVEIFLNVWLPQKKLFISKAIDFFHNDLKNHFGYVSVQEMILAHHCQVSQKTQLSNQKINVQINKHLKEGNTWTRKIGYTMMTKRKAIYARSVICAVLKQLSMVGSID